MFTGKGNRGGGREESEKKKSRKACDWGGIKYEADDRKSCTGKRFNTKKERKNGRRKTGCLSTHDTVW